MAAATPLNIHTELLGPTAIADSKIPTKLLRHVLHAAANDRVADDFDVEVGYSIVKTAREACDEVDTKIVALDNLEKKEVEAEVDANDEAAWNLFDEFTEGIIAIEDALLTQQGLFDSEQIVLGQNTVTKADEAAVNWSTRREKSQAQLGALQDVLRKLKKETPATPTTWQQERDDRNLISRLASLIDKKAKGSSESHDFITTALQELNASLDSLRKEPSPGANVFDGIKGAWIVYSAILERESGAADRKDYLDTEPVWKAVEVFAEVIKGLNHTEFSAAYGTLLTVLLGGAVPPNKRYFQIVQTSSKVVPPFVRRNRILVRFCRDLVRAYNLKANESTRVTNNALVLKALKEILEAITEITELHKGSLWDADKTAAVTAISKAQGSLKGALEKYDSTKAANLVTEMGTATSEDDSGISRLKTKWEQKPEARPTVDPSTEIEVTLAGLSGGEKKLKVPKSTKVSALIWHQNHESTSVRYTGATKKNDADAVEEVDVTQTLGVVAGNDATTLTLTLVQE